MSRDTGPRGDEDSLSRDDRKAISRRRILDSARDVFFRDGFMAANLDEVAEGAGVAKGTLYRYFASKADLYVAVLADNGDRFTEKMREVASRPGRAPERVHRLASFYLGHWLRHREYFQIFWAIDNQPVIGALPGRVVSEIARLWEGCLSILCDVIEQGVRDGEVRDCDGWEVANILWTLANALIASDATEVQRTLRRRPLEETYADAIDLVLRGIRA